MPRDKTESHKLILEIAKKEFLANGFEKTSIREIGKKAGLTSAALYRHSESKEDLFCQLVEPAIKAMNDWVQTHIDGAHKSIESNDFKSISSQSEIDMIRIVVLPRRDEFKLLLSCSAGTKYENFLHDTVIEHEALMREGFNYLEAHGFKIKQIDDEELHILISAYLTALFEPIVHDYPIQKIPQYLDLIEQFFMPGWHEILGI